MEKKKSYELIGEVMTSQRWNDWGNWNDIANTSDENFIKERITGFSKYWKPNSMPIEVSSLIPQGSVIVDFGCGLGRNAESLMKLSPHVIGYDIPEMIDKLTQKTHPYERVSSNLREVLDGADVVYESVVIQHILSIEELEQIAQDIQDSSVQLFISLHNTVIPDSNNFVSSLLKWDLVVSLDDFDSFKGLHHIYRCFRRPV